MENLTHTLVGLAAAKAGLERTSPYATATCLVAANLPDADIVTLVAGPSVYLEQHRGVSHSIAGTLALGLLLPAVVYAVARLAARLRGRPPRARFKGLLISSLLVTATHPLLDWTNSYGVRPWLPWSGEWVYGDLVFIVDPWLWLLLGGACFLAASETPRRAALWAALGLLLTAALVFLPRRMNAGIPTAAYVVWFAGLGLFVAARLFDLPARWGRAIPSAALALVVAYWGGLALVHRRALEWGRFAAADLAAGRGERVETIAAMPLLADPLAWRYAFETDRATWRFDSRVTGATLDGVEESDVRNLVRVEKPSGADGALVEQAAGDERARVLLDFARFPVARLRRGCVGEVIVQFSDLRFTEPGRNSRGGSFSLEVPVRR
ncbi:MAG TPA: metal-dependent hydrolase [Pyrinomonadaceae bacterium]|nr:metal-dependent hydrolase [Pyrinomonadaceae bacterium]